MTHYSIVIELKIKKIDIYIYIKREREREFLEIARMFVKLTFLKDNAIGTGFSKPKCLISRSNNYDFFTDLGEPYNLTSTQQKTRRVMLPGYG